MAWFLSSVFSEWGNSDLCSHHVLGFTLLPCLLCAHLPLHLSWGRSRDFFLFVSLAPSTGLEEKKVLHDAIEWMRESRFSRRQTHRIFSCCDALCKMGKWPEIFLPRSQRLGNVLEIRFWLEFHSDLSCRMKLQLHLERADENREERGRRKNPTHWLSSNSHHLITSSSNWSFNANTPKQPALVFPGPTWRSSNCSDWSLFPL